MSSRRGGSTTAAPSRSRLRSAVVVGAGIFGGSLALRLVSSGWDVTVVEQYPPGHVRAASGGESRLIRFAHGDNAWYTGSARRALDLWRELERETGNRAARPVRRRVVLHGHARLGRGERARPQRAGDRGRAARARGRRPSLPELRRTGASRRSCSSPKPACSGRATRRGSRSSSRSSAERTSSRATAAPDGDAVLVGGDRLEADRIVWAGGAWLAGLFPSSSTCA